MCHINKEKSVLKLEKAYTFSRTVIFHFHISAARLFIYCIYFKYVKENELGQISRYSGWLQAKRPRGRSLSPGMVKNVLLSTPSRLALGPTQPI
jgi:hypothetical protein